MVELCTRPGKKLSQNMLEGLQNGEHKRRERNRRKQQRYRDQQNCYLAELETEVNQLRNEIQRLQLGRECGISRVSSQSNVKNMRDMVTKYFRLFRNGMQLSNPANNDTFTTQREFLYSVMAPDVIFNGGHGVAMLLNRWLYTTFHHQDLDIELVRLKDYTEGLMVAEFIWQSTISEKVLHDIFSHASDDTKNKKLALAVKTLDTRFSASGFVHIFWDETKMQITGLEYTVDTIVPLQILLGALPDIPYVINSGVFSFWGQ
ncbi:hypothetical protein PHMEG_00013381 [Phytophthora megakarya]|uniref:Bzip transcription factor n=1 Tax=Phytophthora megakarya TaxID=4795 RepID=A0A225W6U0_9STRA|nr:hypothetical protein PHMEG_00013381 [Phytophthora megakarya]